ncbi:MAG: thiamine biosynthesis lipoprotein ApbE [Acidimicrobiales bacterium]|nr:thiamine biosynthesis lipoprotein ApbE [Acidimicrobiales bacterium]
MTDRTALHEIHFRAMGTDVHVVIVGGDAGLLDAARARIDELERRWSRFRDVSEVSQLNERAGELLAVSAETRLLVTRAIEAWEVTGGRFDPTVLGDVVRAGYDRSYDTMEADVAPGFSTQFRGCSDIVVEGAGVRLPSGTGFDPGGIGKGLAADLVVAEAMGAGAAGACVNLGGDLRAAGTSPDGQAWTIAVGHPWQRDPITRLGLAAGAVATSTTLRRAWRVDGRPAHHVVDPETGVPAETGIELATVVTGEGWLAEALATSVLLGDPSDPFDVVRRCGAEALAVTGDGTVLATAGLPQFTGGADLPPTVTRRPR